MASFPDSNPSNPVHRDPLAAGEIVAHQGFLRSLARGLVADPALADDLVQSTYLQVLERQPARPRRLKAWLAKVVANLARDRRRADDRRLVHEQSMPQHALRGAAPASTVELVQRMELHRRLVELVLALDEHYREVVLLHHFEGLSVAQTAARLGLPLETARTRLRRALVTLRERLDRELGGRDAARAALLPIARLELVPPLAAAPVATATSLGALLGVPLLMSTSVKLSLAAASALVIGGVVYLATRGASLEPPRPIPAASAVEESARAAELEARAAAPADAASPDRTLLPVAPEGAAALAPLDPSRCALRIRTVWEHDGSAAPQMPVRLATRDHETVFPCVRRARTDDAGALVLRDVAPGAIEIAVAGFGGDRETAPCVKAVALVAGEARELTLEVPATRPIVGEVVDAAGRPIEGAEIWMGDRDAAFSDGMVVTRSDRSGRFRIESSANMHFIAASAPGYAMSNAMHPAAHPVGDERSIRLVLTQRGASLRGRVLDAERAPVAQALVIVDLEEGTSMLIDGGAILERPPPRLVRTDADGRFEIEGLAPEAAVVVAHREPGPVVARKVELQADAARDVELVLGQGGALRGFVRDGDGGPIAGAKIQTIAWVGARLYQLAIRNTDSADDGAFEMAGLSAGSHDLTVDAGANGSLRMQVEIAESATLERELVIRRGGSLRGRVVDEGGSPVASVRVAAEPVASAPRIPEAVMSREDGSFAIDDCADVDWKLVVYPDDTSWTMLLEREPLRPDGDEIVLVLGPEQRATAQFVVRLLDADGRPVPAVVNVFQLGGRAIYSYPVGKDGEFTSPSYPPGRYHVDASADGFASIPFGERELHANETLDLGEHRFELAAILLVKLERGDGGRVKAGDLVLRTIDGTGSSGFTLVEGALRAESLRPGAYLLDVVGEGLARQQVRVVARPGTTTTVDVHADAGVVRRFAISREDGASLGGAIRWTASDASGDELRGSLTVKDEATVAVLALCLAEGDWSIELVAPDGARGEATLTASHDRGPEEPIGISLRR